MTSETTNEFGLQLMVAKREGMQSLNHIRTLLNHGSNREAAAIVASFQQQMEFEEASANLKVA